MELQKIFSFSRQMSLRKGFTLIELLIVIAIIGVLSVVVILVINPAELLRQSRDSSRISDLATLKGAIALYFVDVSPANLNYGSSTYCYMTIPAVAAYTPTSLGTWTLPLPGGSVCANWFASDPRSLNDVYVTATSMLRSVNGTGWLPINFTTISSGAPIGSLPVDPINQGGTAAACANVPSSTVVRSSCGLYYSYISSAAATFKLGALTESAKYSTGGPKDVESADGGINPYVYEQGSDLTL